MTTPAFLQKAAVSVGRAPFKKTRASRPIWRGETILTAGTEDYHSGSTYCTSPRTGTFRPKTDQIIKNGTPSFRLPPCLMSSRRVQPPEDWYSSIIKHVRCSSIQIE